jgi:hypothetical protein
MIYKFYFRHIFLTLTISLLWGEIQAQGTTLALGDIAFTGYNCTPAANSDEFSFVILKSTGITTGTTIYFTDRGWKSGSCGTDNFCTTADNASFPESGSHFVWTSSGSLSYGTHVKIAGAGTSTTFTCSNGSASGTVLNLSNAGDQIFALQNGSGSTTIANGGAGTMLTAIHANKATASGCTYSTTSWDNCTTNISVDICQSANNSNRPACLTNGTNCIALLDGSSNEVDNGVYNCTSSNNNTSGAAITAMRTAINTLSNWTTQNTTALTIPPSGCSPLPVTWIHFVAAVTDFGALLEWSTSSERNSSHFDVERSENAIEWKKVGEVAGGGTKNTISTYYYNDVFNTEGIKYVYYRIRQVDFDYKFEYTPVRAAVKEEGAGKYSAFTFNGNPISEATSLKTFLPSPGEARIEISDTRGNVLFSKTFQYYGGYNRFMFNNEVPEIMNKSGVYFVKASIEGEEKTFKLVVQ